MSIYIGLCITVRPIFTNNAAHESLMSEAYKDITKRMVSAAHAWQRSPDDVTLIAITKTFDEAAIEPLLDAGHRVFGENRVQEAKAKWPALKERYPDIELHLVGPLQTNKLADAIDLFDVIHTLDREKLAASLGQARDKGRALPRLFVQVNTGEEPQKSGIAPAELGPFIKLCRETYGLAPEGLMCIPPEADVPAPHFALLAKLAQSANLPELSMGMSQDFESAIAQGATYIRVGRALFGSRSI